MTDKTDSKEREAIARAIWALMREHEDRCDEELEDLSRYHPVWEYADAARASLAASAVTDCARCGGSGEDPEGFYDQSRGDAGHTHDGPCRTCNGSGVAASAGSEPVAHLWQHSETGRTRVLMPDMIVDADASWRLVGPLFLGSPPSPPEGMVGGWMPIETAPKDGKLILVNFKIKGVRAVSWDSPFHDEVTEENGIWCVDDDKHGPYALRGYNDDGPTAPTHWMPLPPPPTSSADSRKGE